MPIYTYECSACGEFTEELRNVGDRNARGKCEVCESPTHLVIVTPAHLDNLGMGTDPDFPTASDRWAKIQRSKNTGKQWDSNNRRYGGDWERKR